MGMLFLSAVGALALVLWVGVALVREPRASATAGERRPLSRAVAEAILRGQLVRGGATCTAGFAATAAGIAFDAAGWSVVLAIISVFLLRGVTLRREALRRLADPETTAHRRRTWLILNHAAGETHVEVSLRAFRIAQQRSVPTATVRVDR